MAKEYKILQVALGAEDVESALNHTVRDDWNFLSCVALGPSVLCYTFWREKRPVGRRRIEDSVEAPKTEVPHEIKFKYDFEECSVEQQEKELDAEFNSICNELRQGRVSTSREADTVAAAVLARKVVSTDKAKKILSRSESDSTKKVRRAESKDEECSPIVLDVKDEKDCTTLLQVKDEHSSEVRISPRTGKPMRVYKKRIK